MRLAGLALGVAIAALGACGGGEPSPLCQAHADLRNAVRAMDAARAATAQGDAEATAGQMDEVDRLLLVARGRLIGADAHPETGRAARAMLEAANYLDFMTGQHRSTGATDYSITQFASRELTRAAAGAGGAPLNC